MAKSVFKEEPMAEACLKRSSGVMALLQSVLAFLGMKRHRDTIKMQKGCACDKMEGGAYVSSKITVISGTSKPLQCY